MHASDGAGINRATLYAGVIIAVAVSVVVAWQGLVLDRATGQTISGGYEFDITRVEYAKDDQTGQVDPTRARVEYELSWATEDFPGLRQCHWEVRDSTGRIVGSVHGTVQATASVYTHTFAQFVPVRGEPATADVTCDSSRIDNPDRQPIVSNVELKPKTDHRGAAYNVAFDLEWTGSGRPAPQECVTRVYDENGELLFVDEGGLDIDETVRQVTLAVSGPTEARDRAASADVSCSAVE